MYNQQKMRWGAVLLALALAAAVPLAAIAESDSQMPNAAAAAIAGGALPKMAAGMRGRMMGSASLDTSTLTEEQKAAYDSALLLYEQVEDAVLKDLVSAGVVAQEDVDAYIALRSAQKSLASLDQSGWTAEQYKAFYEANAKTGDERKAAMQALCDSGLLLKDQADALGAQGQTGLWTKIMTNAKTNSAIQTALSTMQQARKTLNQSLSDAGIEGLGRGGMLKNFGQGAMHFFGNDKNDKGNGQKGNGRR